MNYQKLSNNELLTLLFTEEDRLPRAAVEEFIMEGVYSHHFGRHLVVDFQPLNG